MKIKRFRGRTVAEVVERVKREWGPDALILQARRVRSRRRWPFWRPVWEFEVTAAWEEAAPASPPPRGGGPAAGGGPHRDPAADAPAGLRDGGPSPAAASGEAGHGLPAGLEDEVRQMKELIGIIWRQLQAREGERQGPEAGPPLYPEALEPVYRSLVEREVEPSLARCLADLLLEGAEGKGPGLLRQEAIAAIERLLGPAQPVDPERARVVALVGPTGAGKTTTLAKLAAHFSLRERRRVCLITVDTFRVGALDQLRAYAAIAGLPCWVAGSPPELASLLDRACAAHDLVLIDTAGRSHHDELRMSELAAFWAVRRPDEIHLVVSATTRYSDGLEIVDRYRQVGFDRLLFTKLDETRRHGLILNLSVVAQRPLSYVTTGQQVPEDIAVARPGDLAKLLV